VLSPNAAARYQQPSWREKGYLRNMLSRRINLSPNYLWQDLNNAGARAH
jgi:hypothetical protein